MCQIMCGKKWFAIHVYIFFFCFQAAKECAKKLEDENALKEREYSEEVHLAWHQLTLMLDVALYLTANLISSNVIYMFYLFKRHAKRKRRSLK
jgi:hypothetical protein